MIVSLTNNHNNSLNDPSLRGSGLQRTVPGSRSNHPKTTRENIGEGGYFHGYQKREDKVKNKRGIIFFREAD